jgi:membrane fusion protein (multidrug efflux system)
MKTRIILVGLALAAFFGAVFGWKAFVNSQIRSAIAARGAPVVTVSTATAQAMDWPVELTSVATLKAEQAVDVTAQVDGQITALHFDSGAAVERGDLLVQQYAADDAARLKALQADLRLASIQLERARKLVAEKLVPQSDFDAAESRLDRVAAEVENLQIEIAKKSIRAPFSGRLGIRLVDLGQHIEPGDALVRLESLDRLFADFRLPQQSLPLLAVGQSVVSTVDALPGQSFSGKIVAIEPAVDASTRNVLIRATLDNADGRLHPGMFAEIRVQLPASEPVVVVPQAAVAYSPFGDAVYVVSGTDGLVARSVYVQSGKTRGNLVAIISGLKPGEVVVTAGHHKLRDGASVRIDNSVPVADDPTPEPAET